LLLLTSLTLACGCATGKVTAPRPATAGLASPRRNATVDHFDALSKRYKKPFGLAAKSFLLSLSDNQSVHYVTISARVAPHLHRDHDELFVLVSGQGILYLTSADGGVESHELVDGSIVHIPKGVAHAYEHFGAAGSGSRETLALSVFSPPYTSPDRHPVDWSPDRDKATTANGED
jgi:quercetin dioxygenase-like cupin family protein